MRILYLSGSNLPSRAANSVHVMKMCAALAKAGHEVILSARGGSRISGELFDFYGVDPTFSIEGTTAIGGRTLARFRHLRRVTTLCKRIRPDLIYSRYLPGLYLLKNTDIPYVCESHNRPTHLQQIMENRLFRSQSFFRLVVISRALEEEYRRIHTSLDSQKVTVAPDAADPPPETFEPSEVDKIRRSSDRIQVGYVGHLYAGRGIEVIEALAARLTTMDFHIVGGTEIDLARWRKKLSGGNIHLHGFVSPAKTDLYRFSMDVLVAPYQQSVLEASGKTDTSRWMSPLKVFEYMAAGRAIIASDLPTIREILIDGQNALLVGANNIEDWCRALHRLEDRAFRERLSRVAKNDFSKRFSWAARSEVVLQGLRIR